MYLGSLKTDLKKTLDIEMMKNHL